VKAACRRVHPQVDGESAVAARALDDGIQAAGEAAVLERGRVQAADDLAQILDRRAQLLAGAHEQAGVAVKARAHVLADGEQYLERFVVKRL
jgi:hypothetical protein